MRVGDLERLYDYHYWANRKLFSVVSQLTPEQFTQPIAGSYGSVRNTLVHVLSAEWGWLDRCGGPARGERLDPGSYPTVESLVRAWTQVEGYMSGFLSGLKDEDLVRDVEFALGAGPKHSVPLGDLMQHAAVHAVHHRGQVALLLRTLGSAPGNFDLLLYDIAPASRVTTLLLPGLFDSGPEHWQSHWERTDPTCRRVQQADWETPRCTDWVTTLDAEVASVPGPLVLVAHSSSCALVAHWARSASAAHLAQVRGALLVAPSDPEGPNYPAGPTGFAPMPLARLPFRSIVVASTDDEYVTPALARAYAAAWGSEYVEIGAAGHINSASGLGAWPAGAALLEQLRASA